MYALVDCNNFYCSCERVFQPWLNGRPVIVLSNNDGCAIARSEEAKALGIEMGTPAFMIEDLIEKNNVAVFSSNYVLYGDMSERVIDLLSRFAPRIEMYSIDECFLDLSELKYEDLTKLAVKIRDTIMKCTGIPVSIGIAATKTLAKLANRFAKKKKREVGVHWLRDQELANKVLASTEVGDIWGVGRQYERLLRQNGFKTALDLIGAPDEWIRKNMSVVGQRTVNELRGIPCLEWEDQPPPKKGICTARSFGQLLSEKGPIREAVANYAGMCAKKLRDQDSCAKVMQVFLQTNVHRSEDKQFHRTITIQLPVPTNSTNEVIAYALQGFETIYKPGYNFKKAGVMIIELVPATEVQTGLFDKINRKRDNRLMQALDKVNMLLGKDIVRFASQGYERKWRLRQEMLSQRYTTNINEVLTIKI